jgi:hypothetical protein
MRFWIGFASSTGGDEDCPVEGAEKEEIPPIAPYLDAGPVTAWSIEVADLDALLALSERCGEALIVRPTLSSDDWPTIFIDDDHPEDYE